MRLKVDWPNCQARGICAEVFPDRIGLDPWGYPVISSEDIDSELGTAKEAIAACPRLALRLVD